MRKSSALALILALILALCTTALGEGSPLVVRGYGFDPYMIPAFERDHPEIALDIDNDFSIGRAQFVSMIQSGDPSVDICVLPDTWNVWALIDKGFSLDLSPYPALNDRIKAMNPQVLAAVSRDGKVCALPVAMNVFGWSVRPELLEAAGYAMPATLQAFFEMQKDWDEEKAGELDFTFASTAYDSYGLRLYPYVEMAVSMYITQYELPTEPLSFDTPVFRQTLSAIEALGYPPENVDEALNAVKDDMQLFEVREAVFDLNDNNPLNVSEVKAYDKALIPPLPYEAGGVQRAEALLFLALVNPYSRHLEEAITFLSYAAEQSATDATLTLYPHANDPILDQGVLKSLEEAQQELDKQQRLLEGADEAHQAEINAAIAQWQAVIDELMPRQYLVTAEAIAAYRALEPYLYIRRDSPYWRTTTEIKAEIEDIIKRYAAGAIDGEGLIQALDQKFLLVYMEQ